jgi:hypothetical protein
MLHFLIGTAVCIWIAERVTHYWGEWRWRRQQRRYVRWLQGEDIRTGLPPWVTPLPSPPPQPERERRSDTYVTVGLCVAFAGVLLAIALH